MKLLFGLLALVALAQASKRFTKADRYMKQNLHREPPIVKYAIFNAAEIVETKWIEQRLNHFDPQDLRVWNMRYMENNFFLQNGGPIFIFGE